MGMEDDKVHDHVSFAVADVPVTRLARAIGARVVIPRHYEMFEFNTASPQAFVDG